MSTKKIKFDPEKIKQNIVLSAIIGQDVALKKNGNHKWIGCCPFHDDRTPSFDVNDEKGVYFCFGCGSTGDVIDYIIDSRDKTFQQACLILGGEELKLQKIKKSIIKSEPKDDLIQIFPAPEEASKIEVGQWYEFWNPKQEKYTKFNPVLVHQYKNKDGQLLGYICRIHFDFNDQQQKIYYTLTYCQKIDGQKEWCIKSFPLPRPLYRIETIEDNNEIMICEGEKSADACQQLLGGNVISWVGGTQAVNKADFSQLKNKKICIWLDADRPGLKASEELKQQLFAVGVERLRIVYPPLDEKEIKKGFDAADALEQGWSKDQTITFLKKYVKIVEKLELKIANESNDIFDLQDYFAILGYDRGNYFYLPSRAEQIVSLTAAAHTKPNLFQLAPSGWWEVKFSHLGEKGKINWDMIISALIDKSAKKGIFWQAKRLRGRGAWLENGKKIMHLGDVVFVDGEAFKPAKTNTKCIYEASYPLSFPPDTKALSDEEAIKFWRICNEFSWENKLSGKLLAGWCVLAPICGMLEWRPHIFITGASGAGKSTINNMLIKRILGDFGLFLEGGTTEAGIRQELYKDALPVVFDEAEAEDKQALQTMKSIFRLARLSSSGSNIKKGLPTGGGVHYVVRAMFCFFAINPALNDYADESRTTKLILRKNSQNGSKEKYDDLVTQIQSTISIDYANSMIKRTFDNIESLLHNIKIFSQAAREIFTEKRHADQLAPMLAGCYLCVSTDKISLEEAKEWLVGEDWIEHSTTELVKDEDRLLNTILTTKIKHDDGQFLKEYSVGELIEKSSQAGRGVDSLANHDLKRIGICVDDGFVHIANQSIPMKKLLIDTPWIASWGQQLKNIKQSELSPLRRYSPGIRSRGVKISIDYILSKKDD